MDKEGTRKQCSSIRLHKRRPERESFKATAGMSHLTPDSRRLRLFCFGGKFLSTYRVQHVWGYGMKTNKHQVLLSGLLMPSFSRPHIPVGYKTNQTTNPQTYLHLQHYCSHFSMLLERERVIHILVLSVWVSFSTAPLPSFYR